MLCTASTAVTIQPHHVQVKPQLPLGKIPLPALKNDGSLWFSWDQSSKNLFCATEPTYDTSQVTIPSKVLRLGPENKKDYVVRQFHKCSSPPGSLIHAVLMNMLWDRECRITCWKLGYSLFMFRIPHENICNRLFNGVYGITSGSFESC